MSASATIPGCHAPAHTRDYR